MLTNAVPKTSDIEEFIDLLHYDTSTKRGNIRLFMLKGEEGEEHKLMTYEALQDRTSRLIGLNDVYISSNTFYGYKGKVENLWQLRSLYVDLDIFGKEKDGSIKNKTGYGIDETFEMVLNLADDEEIPEPTMIVYSGGGLHLYWRIKDAPKQALKFWQNIEHKLIEKLKPLGADPSASDGARILRVPNTINSKYGVECKIWYINRNAFYTLSELQERYFPKEQNEPLVRKTKLPATKKANEAGTAKTTPLLNPHTLQFSRANDLFTLVTLRNGNLQGLRNCILLDYCYFRGFRLYSAVELEREALNLNNYFYEQLPLYEVKGVVRRAWQYIEAHKEDAKKGLNSLNETLIDKYKITEEEMEKGNFETIITKELKQRRQTLKKTPRDENGLTQKQKQLIEDRKKAFELRVQGLTVREIAQSLSCSVGKIHKLLKS